MNTVSISRNVHVRNAKGKKLADAPITGTFTYDFPETVEEYTELVGTSEKWPDDTLVRLANEALLSQLKNRVTHGLSKALFHGTKNAALEMSEEDLTTIQTNITNYAPFQTRRAAPRKESNRALRSTFEEKGDAASAIAMFDGHIESFREAVRNDPSKASRPDLVEIYKSFDPILLSYGLKPLSEELLEIAAETEIDEATDI